MREPIVFAIDGAQTMRDIRRNLGAPYADDTVRVPDMDYTYKYGMLTDKLLWASRDGWDFVIAITVECNGKRATHKDMVKALWN